MSRNIKLTLLILFAISLQGLFGYTAQAQYYQANIPKPETLDALVIDNSNQVLLRGQVTNTAVEITPIKGYFEWGTTRQLGNSTFIQNLPTARVINFSHVLSGLSENRIYYYRVVAFNDYGIQAGGIKEFRTGREENLPPPVVPPTSTGNLQTQKITTYPPKYSISSNGAQVTFVGFTGITDAYEKGAVAWFEWGRTSSLGNQTSVKVLRNRNAETFESDRVSGFIPNTTYYARAVVKDKTGTYFGDIISFSLSDPEGKYAPIGFEGVPTQGDEVLGLPYAVTYLPDIIRSPSGTQVQFKGYAEANKNREVKKSANVWFEWGETPALDEKTSSQFFGEKGTFLSQERFIGFTSDKLYYYRAAIQDPLGTAYGDIVSFSVPEGAVQTTAQGQGGFFNIFSSAAQTSIVDIREIKGGGGGELSEETEEGEVEIPAQDQIAIVSASEASKNGIFPSTLVGWLMLSFGIFVMVGLVLYIGELTKKLKKIESQSNGNGEVLNKKSA